MINLTIDKQQVAVEENTTIFRAAKQAGIEIPHLCEFEALTSHGGCRMCVVEVDGVNTLQTSCTYPAQEGMVVHTDTPKVREARRFVLSLIFSERNHFCMYCPKTSSTCELQAAAYQIDMDHWDVHPNWDVYPLDTSHPYMAWDHNRCILCQRCVRACEELAGRHVIVPEHRGAAMTLTTDYGLPWGESSCVNCGTCLQVCPTGAILEKRNPMMDFAQALEGEPGVCVECGLGCQTMVYSLHNQLVRISGDWEGAVNHGVLCEKGRFTAVANLSQTRVKQPLMRMDGRLEPVSWQEALAALHEQMSGKPAAAVISARQPQEVLARFQQVFGELGCQTVTSSEWLADGYEAVLAVAHDPRLAVVEPEMFGKRGKANSAVARKIGLTDPLTVDGGTVFVMLGDDPDHEALAAACRQVDFSAVQSAYLYDWLEEVDLVLPAPTWLEQGGTYVNLMGREQTHQAHLQAPEGVLSSVALLALLEEMMR